MVYKASPAYILADNSIVNIQLPDRQTDELAHSKNCIQDILQRQERDLQRETYFHAAHSKMTLKSQRDGIKFRKNTGPLICGNFNLLKIN